MNEAKILIKGVGQILLAILVAICALFALAFPIIFVGFPWFAFIGYMIKFGRIDDISISLFVIAAFWSIVGYRIIKSNS